MALYIAAMFLVPTLDAGAKLLGETLEPVFIAFMRYVIQTVLLLAILTALRHPIITGTRASMPLLIQGGALQAVAIASLFWALQYLPLANTVAIFFVAPLIMTIFSAVFLGEKVGWHRTGAVMVGLLGALVVLRPNVALYGWAALLPLLTAVTFAGAIITLRKVSAGLDPFRVQVTTGAFATLVLGAAVLIGHPAGVTLLSAAWPTTFEWTILIGIGVVATVAQTLVTRAVKLAEASLLAPFQYLEIVGATLLGYFIFSEFPDALTWTGTAIILSAGLYVIHRERRLARVAAS